MTSPSPLAVYVHWPFCKSKCPYCDFNSHVREGVTPSDWLAAYQREIAHYAAQLGERRVASIFFGGGTPSLMDAATVEGILASIASHWQMEDDVEITLEANPTSIESQKFRDFRHAGINRLSVGVQALDDEALKFLGREHSATEALKAFDVVKQHFDRYSFDLIYARPGHTLASWKAELEQALRIAGNHMSLYQLTIEKGTPFYQSHQNGVFRLPEDELSAELYDYTTERMAQAGLAAYEVSNYATPGEESRHNLHYWRYGEYVGIGAGAHGRITLNGARTATMAIHHPERWQEAVMQHGHGIQQQDALSPEHLAEEYIMMGMRLSEGISHAECQQMTGKALEEHISLSKLTMLVGGGLVECDAQGIRATHQGRLVLNSVVSALLG